MKSKVKGQGNMVMSSRSHVAIKCVAAAGLGLHVERMHMFIVIEKDINGLSCN